MSLYKKADVLILKKIPFLDIKHSFFGYRKINPIFFYQKNPDFLYQEIDFSGIQKSI